MTEAPFPIPPSVEDKPRVFPVPGWRELMYCSLLAWLPWMWTVLVLVLLIVVADADWMITLPTFVGVYVLLYVLVVLLTAGMAKLLLRLNHHSPLMAHVLLTCGILAVLSLIFCRDALFGREGGYCPYCPCRCCCMDCYACAQQIHRCPHLGRRGGTC